MRILLAALVGAVAIFAWEFVAHMFTPLGEAGVSYLPNEATVSAALASGIGDRGGFYVYPTGGLTKDSSGKEKQAGIERIMEEIKTKPSGLLLYKPPGATFNFGKNLAVQFLTDFLKALLAVWLLAQTRLATLGGRVGFVVGLGVIAGLATNVPYWNWYGFPGDYTVAQVFMEIAGFFFAGLAIALVFRRAPAPV
jgi:hypothetical protein